MTILEGVMLLRAALPAGTPLIVLEVSAAEARRRILARDEAKGRTPLEIAGRIDRRNNGPRFLTDFHEIAPFCLELPCQCTSLGLRLPMYVFKF